MRNITKDFFGYVEGQNTKVGKRVYKWLMKDYLRGIYVENGVFWFEVGSIGGMPNYVYDYIVSWGKRQGYKFFLKYYE